MPDTTPKDADALKAIHAEIEADRIKLHRNALSEPYVFLDHPGYPALHAHLFDADVRGWLTHFIWEAKGHLLREREMDRILAELAGRSLSERLDKIHDPALLRCIESEPVVAVLLEFMNTRERHEATMEALWKELKSFAHGRRLLVLGKNRFPGGSNVLSRKLNRLLAVFQQLGIGIDIKRSNGCKVILTRRLDDVTKEPSAASSTPNSTNSEDLSPKDDKDERILRLRRRKHSNEEGSHEEADD